MITYELIHRANITLPRMDIKGKQYAVVPGRVQAFRQICPNGSIETEIVALEDGVVTMMASVKDEDGRVLATGYAQEKESSSYINKTSFIENCETSAVGRALGFLGLGSESSMASAEEVANAIHNQEMEKVREEKIDSEKVAALVIAAKRANVSAEQICAKFGIKSLGEMTEGQFRECVAMLEKQAKAKK